jgi:ribonuclease III
MRGLLKPRSTFSKKLREVLGFRPGNEFFYEVAFRHSSTLPNPKFSSQEGNHNNQRLELLGDAILGAVCADIVYHSFPSADEGFLSTMRSKIVNRRTLNRIAMEMQLDTFLQIEGKKGINAATSIYGDALEALIGAIYLDKGYKYCNRFIRNRLMEPHIDFNELSKSVFSYKGLMLEWAQKHRKKIHYDSFEGNAPRTFDSIISIDGKQQARASGASKKRAEESAAEKAAKILKITKDKLAPKPKKITIDD